MYAQQYENPSRIVTGTPVLTNDDVVLYCDTSTGSVTINLLDIPNNYWMTTWKLYVVDYSNNASTNNITINAGNGQTINAQSSIKLSVNGGSCIVRITGNTTFICEPLAIDVSDTGWVDLQGFTFLSSTYSRKPQFRVIGKQVFFRGTAIVPLSTTIGGDFLIPMTDSGVGGFYTNDPYAYVYQGPGGCVLDNNGALTFNLGNDVFPPIYNIRIDNNYSKGYQIYHRVVKTKDANAGVALSGLFNIQILANNTLYLQTYKDIELSPNVPNTSIGLGYGGARVINSKVTSGQFPVDWKTQANGVTQSSINAFTNTRVWTVNGGSNQFLFDVDPAEETLVGGFQINLDGLMAFKR